MVYFIRICVLGTFKIGQQLTNFTCLTCFALVFTFFICCGCNFTWSSIMYMTKCNHDVSDQTKKKTQNNYFCHIEVNPK